MCVKKKGIETCRFLLYCLKKVDLQLGRAVVVLIAGLLVRDCTSIKKTEKNKTNRPEARERLVMYWNMLTKTATDSFCHDLLASISGNITEDT